MDAALSKELHALTENALKIKLANETMREQLQEVKRLLKLVDLEDAADNKLTVQLLKATLGMAE